MKFNVEVGYADEPDGVTWVENYDKGITDAETWARDTIDQFNATLRPKERARRFVSVIVTDTVDDHHRWIKRTAGQSIMFRGRIVDLLYCDRCGVTAKRIGLTNIKLDSKYRAKKYQRCTGGRGAI